MKNWKATIIGIAVAVVFLTSCTAIFHCERTRPHMHEVCHYDHTDFGTD